MIVHKDDYYQIHSTQEHVPQQRLQQSTKHKQKTFQLQGNTKQRLQLIRQRFQQLKTLKKNEQPNDVKQTINFAQITHKQNNYGCDIAINITVPKQVKQLERRANDLEDKFKCGEIIRQKMERKGNLVSRINSLQGQLVNLAKLQQENPDKINKNILEYLIYAEQREQLFKIMFLYQSFTTSQGLRQQIDIIKTYLKNLQGIKLKLNSSVPLETMIKDHNQLLIKRREVSIKIHTLFDEMKKKYEELSKEIDQIDV